LWLVLRGSHKHAAGSNQEETHPAWKHVNFPYQPSYLDYILEFRISLEYTRIATDGDAGPEGGAGGHTLGHTRWRPAHGEPGVAPEVRRQIIEMIGVDPTI
jgi:hypothetical protein